MIPLVSILIPAHNAEPWIAETLASALAQTWPRKEIVVVDDGSSDRTLHIARQFASENVVVTTQEKQGASAARNRAFELCNGDYIQWLDADDLLAPDKITKQMERVEHIADKRALLSASFGIFLYRCSKTQFYPTPLWADLPALEWLLLKMGQNLYMQTATWLVSRELTEAAGPWDTRLSLDDDGEYFCRVLLASDGVHFVPEARVYYRASGPSTLSNVDITDKKLESQYLSMQRHVQYLRSMEESERVRVACIRYLQTWFIYFVAERPDLAEQMQRMAVSLGGELEVPRIRKKYAWIERTLGYRTAKRSQMLLPQVRWSIIRWWDKLLFGFEK
jgi:glycosyltransferase involved in cell wall biosynthesis